MVNGRDLWSRHQISNILLEKLVTVFHFIVLILSRFDPIEYFKEGITKVACISVNGHLLALLHEERYQEGAISKLEKATIKKGRTTVSVGVVHPDTSSSDPLCSGADSWL